jgi:predicted SnoaL-like aldol condensation-catalyzing enzyme
MSSSAQPLSLQEQNKHLVIRWFEEVWNQGRRETITELFPDNAILHDGANHFHGPKEFFPFYDSLCSQFSDFRIVPVLTIAEGDHVCLHWAATFLDRKSGQPLNITGTSLCRVENGRFAEAWQNWDAAGLQAQLTALAS